MTNLSKPNIVTDGLPRHGSPQDRGSADAYYGRRFEPHYYTGHTYQSERVDEAFMTTAQIEEYRYGYENEDDRKDWGEPKDWGDPDDGYVVCWHDDDSYEEEA